MMVWKIRHCNSHDLQYSIVATYLRPLVNIDILWKNAKLAGAVIVKLWNPHSFCVRKHLGRLAGQWTAAW